MKLGAIALILAALLTTAWRDVRPVTKVTIGDYKEILQMLRGVEESLEELGGKARADDNEDTDCRGLSPEKTVRCAAEAFDTNVDQALSVWQCESNFGTESDPTGHVHHGPFQFLITTYQSQQSSMPDIVEWYELLPAVHDMRSNILTAVAYASRHGYGPWSCA